MTESNSIEPNDGQVSRQTQLNHETTNSPQHVTSKDNDYIGKSLKDHHRKIERESEDENLTGDYNNNETTDTYETDTCSETDEPCTDVECEVRSSVGNRSEKEVDLISDTTASGTGPQQQPSNRYDNASIHHGRNQRMNYTNITCYMNRFQPPVHYYTRPPQPLATTYYDQAAHHQTTFYSPVCIGLDQSGTPVFPIQLPPSNQPLQFAANDWLYAQCNILGQFPAPYHIAQPAQVFCQNNARQSDLVVALYTAPWVQSPATAFQPVPQPVVWSAMPLNAQVNDVPVKSHRYRPDVPSTPVVQAEKQIDPIACSDREPSSDRSDGILFESGVHKRVEIEDEDCQDNECTECGCNNSIDATAAPDDDPDLEQVDDSVKTNASDITIGSNNVNKGANRLSTSDDDLIHRSDNDRSCSGATVDVDKNQQRRDIQQKQPINESGDSIDQIRSATVTTTMSNEDQETSESSRHGEQETTTELLVGSTDSIIDEKEEREVYAGHSVSSLVHSEEPQNQEQQHNQSDPSVLISDIQLKSYQLSPLPALNGQQKPSMTSKTNILPTNDLSETTPKQQQQQDSGPLAAGAATDDISSDPNVTKDNPSISLRQQTNNQTPLTSGCPELPQPVLHHYQHYNQCVTPNCYVTSNSETNKSSTDLKPVVDTCQLSGATQLLPRQQQNNIRPQRLLYDHHPSPYNPHLVQPPLVYQPPNTSPYLGLIPIINNKQPLIYGYQYGPYYGLVQQCRPTNYQYHQQSTQYYSTPPVAQIPRSSHVSNGVNLQPVPLDPSTLLSYSYHPVLWQHHPTLSTPFNDQIDYLKQFQQPLNTPINGTRLNISLISLLPIDAEPARVRQAYGMDKVWLEEFEALFAQFMSSNMLWTLVQVEINPSIRCDADIIGYKGRYIVRVNSGFNSYVQEGDHLTRTTDHRLTYYNIDSKSVGNTVSDDLSDEGDSRVDVEDRPKRADSQTPITDNQSDREIVDRDDDCSSDGARSSTHVSGKRQGPKEEMMGFDDEDEAKPGEQIVLDINEIYDKSNGISNYGNGSSRQSESDCDSGAVMVNSATTTTSGGEESVSEESQRKIPAERDSPVRENNQRRPSIATDKKHSRRFRMFIDSAKVRFCCDICGHGWTSMKGRVVFWYELFELAHDDNTPGNLIGYCAYKLFGQQCDVCQVEGRFERPMWYPEEVTKALNNLCNKIGQVYFGFKMPAIDKQRRAGKPKTSHNSTLCQACHDGVCTDRK